MALKHKLRFYGDPCLRAHCEPIEKITDEILELAGEMVEICKKYDGAGIAAPQLGVPVRMFMLRNYIVLPDGEWVLSEPVFYLNPKVLEKSKETNADSEGCLSIPGVYKGPIARPNTLKLEAMGLDGKIFTEEREGLNARVFFHENDHLNGVLHIDRLPAKVRKKVDPQLTAIKMGKKR